MYWQMSHKTFLKSTLKRVPYPTCKRKNSYWDRSGFRRYRFCNFEMLKLCNTIPYLPAVTGIDIAQNLRQTVYKNFKTTGTLVSTAESQASFHESSISSYLKHEKTSWAMLWYRTYLPYYARVLYLYTVQYGTYNPCIERMRHGTF